MILHRWRYLNKLKNFLNKDKLVLIYWPRQAWKTTLIKDFISQNWGVYINFETDFKIRSIPDINTFLLYLELNFKIDKKFHWILFLDEVQFNPHIIDILKWFYDLDLNFKIVATGSWLWHLKTNQQTTGLVGRWREMFVFPFDFQEFCQAKNFDLDLLWKSKKFDLFREKVKPLLNEFLNFWWYPKVVLSSWKEEKIFQIGNIINKLIQNDITLWLQSNEIEKFENFLLEIIKQTCNFVKYETFAREFMLSTKTVKKYLFFLEKALIIKTVSPFFTDKTKEISSHKKMYVLDTGPISYILKYFGDKLNDWKFIETFVFTEILKNINHQLFEIKVYKKTNKTEIDFILESYDWKLIPIEVKSWNSTSIPKAFYWFAEKYKDKINFFIKTTKNIYLEKEFIWFKIYFIPFWIIGQFLKTY